MLVQILNIQKSISGLQILSTLFWHYINIFPDGTYLDVYLIGFLPYRSLVDLLYNEEVFISVFAFIVHLSAINHVIQGRLNSFVETIEGFTLLGTDLNVMTNLLAQGAQATVV